MNYHDNMSDDTRELLEAVDIYLRYEYLDETNISIPYNDGIRKELANSKSGEYVTANGAYYIYLRTANEATRAKMSTEKSGMQHDASIKILRGKSGGYMLKVPTKSFEVGDSETKKDLKTIKDFMKTSSFPKDVNKIAVRFLYDCQMLIIALWYSKTKEVTRVLLDLAKQRLIENDYTRNNVGAKSQEQLDVDKKELTEYVRKELGDASIELNFGKQKMSKEEKRANKKRK